MHQPSPPPLQIPMSQIIAADAPLLSPSEWSDHHPQDNSYIYSQYAHYPHFPPSPPISMSGDSPIQTTRMLKMRDAVSSSSCLPTHQLFDLSEVNHFQAPPSPAPSAHSIKPPSVPSALKRSESPADLPPPKKRAVGERVSTKDFIPPDVTGLSKREARLVKNRAAAFLSRQRKREEFECMEARVLELESENARLLSLTQSSLPSTKQDSELLSEIDSLRAQLASARERERHLTSQLDAKQDSPVKLEAVEPSFSSPRFQSSQKPTSAASLGLMQVLLCALPTLLSMPTQGALPATFTLPVSAPSSSPYQWSQNAISFEGAKLEFDTQDPKLNALDISFDTVPSEDGRIRVRIHHPSSSAPSRAPSPGSSVYSNLNSPPASTGLELWTPPQSSSSSPSTQQAGFDFSSYSPSSTDPFLGVGNEYGFQPHSSALFEQDSYSQVSGSDFGWGQQPSRRVRIALKNPPSESGEGGEWEVQVC